MKSFVCVGILCLGLSSCGGTRIMDPSEGNVVGKSAMGVEGYERLIEEAMTKLLDRVRIRQGANAKKVMAYMGILNESNEPSRGVDTVMAAANKIQTMLNASGEFEMMPQLVIQAARQEAGITRANRLLLAKPRKQFMDVLGREGRSPDYFFYATINSATTEASSGRQKNYYLNFQIIDARRGTLFEQVNTNDKSFRKFYN